MDAEGVAKNLDAKEKGKRQRKRGWKSKKKNAVNTSSAHTSSQHQMIDAQAKPSAPPNQINDGTKERSRGPPKLPKQSDELKADVSLSLGKQSMLATGDGLITKAKKRPRGGRCHRKRQSADKERQNTYHDVQASAREEPTARGEREVRDPSAPTARSTTTCKPDSRDKIADLSAATNNLTTPLRHCASSRRSFANLSPIRYDRASASPLPASREELKAVASEDSKQLKPARVDARRERRARRKHRSKAEVAGESSVLAKPIHGVGQGKQPNNSVKPSPTTTIGGNIENNSFQVSIVDPAINKVKRSPRKRPLKRNLQLKNSSPQIDSGNQPQPHLSTPLTQSSSLLDKKLASLTSTTSAFLPPTATITVYNGNTTTNNLSHRRREPRSSSLPNADKLLVNRLAERNNLTSLTPLLRRALSAPYRRKTKDIMQVSSPTSYLSDVDNTVKSLQSRYGRPAATSIATTDYQSPRRDLSIRTGSPGYKLDMRSDVTSPSYHENAFEVKEQKPPKCQLDQFTMANETKPLTPAIKSASMASVVSSEVKEHGSSQVFTGSNPVALGENNALRNKLLQQPARPDKANYVPPHLRWTEKSEVKMEQQVKQQAEAKIEPKVEQKLEPNTEPVKMLRLELKSEWKPKQTKKQKRQLKLEREAKEKVEQKPDDAVKLKTEPTVNLKTEQVITSKAEVAAEPKPPSMLEITAEPKIEVKTEPMLEVTAQPNIEVMTEPMLKAKIEHDVQPKAERKVKLTLNAIAKSDVEQKPTPPHLRWADVVKAEEPIADGNSSRSSSTTKRTKAQNQAQFDARKISELALHVQDPGKISNGESSKANEVKAQIGSSQKEGSQSTLNKQQTPQQPVPDHPQEAAKPLKVGPVKLSLEQRFGHLLPEHLRNLPEPIYEGRRNRPKPTRAEPQRDTATILREGQKDAAELELAHTHARGAEVTSTPPVIVAPNNLHEQQISEAAAGIPTFKVAPLAQLDHELAADETRPEPVLNDNDSDSMLTEISGRGSSSKSPMPRKKPANPWRWFNEDVFSVTSEDPKNKLEYEVAAGGLAGWDGDWAPAPVEWDARGQFINNDRRHIRFMESWMDKQVKESLQRPFKVDTSSPGFATGIIPASGTRKQLQDHPKDCIWGKIPLEYGAVNWDLTEELPPNDPWSHAEGRMTQTSHSSSKAYIKKHHKDSKRTRIAHDAVRKDHIKSNSQKPVIAKEHVPDANIYIRSADRWDVRQITDIYNHYIENTVFASELEKTDESDWVDRLQSVDDESFAFLVAVSKSSKPPKSRETHGGGNGRGNRRGNGRGGRNGQRVFSAVQETILGFAFAEDFAGKNSMYQHTAELQIYVRPDQYKQGVGKTLMDRIIPSLDQGYVSWGATDFLAPDKNKYEAGGRREIRKVIMNVAYRTGEEKDLAWKKKWLEENWEFDQVGNMRNIGMKFGKGVHVAQMLLETNQSHGSSNWFKNEPDRMPHGEIVALRKAEEERLLAEREQQQKQQAE